MYLNCHAESSNWTLNLGYLAKYSEICIAVDAKRFPRLFFHEATSTSVSAQQSCEQKIEDRASASYPTHLNHHGFLMSPNFQRLEQAVHAVFNLGTTTWQAARQHGVNYTTLCNRIARGYASKATTELRGCKSFLTDNEEAIIVKTIMQLAEDGVPLWRSCIADLISKRVSSLPKETQIKAPFQNGIPGKSYLTSFLSRNTTIKMRERWDLEKQKHIAVSPTNVAY